MEVAMNKGIKEVMVKREYNGQIWFEVISIENIYGEQTQPAFRCNITKTSGRSETQGDRVSLECSLQYCNNN